MDLTLARRKPKSTVRAHSNHYSGSADRHDVENRANFYAPLTASEGILSAGWIQ